MTKEQIFFLTAGLILAAVVIYMLVTSKTRKRRRLLGRVRALYGQVPNREYSSEELEKIRSFFDAVHEPDRFAIDDITWNDLSMDRIFIAMNHTFSSVGEEVLYAMLREPVFDEAELRERDRLAKFFAENTALREELSVDFSMIGRTRKYALIRFLSNFRELKLKPDWIHLLPVALLVVAVVLIITVPQMGVLALITAVVVNLYTYYKQKGDVEPYYYSLSAMTYLTDSALKIARHDAPELKKYTEKLLQDTANVRSLRRSLGLLGGSASGGTAGDILSVFLDYIRMLTHFDFIVFNRMVRLVRNEEDRLISLMKTMGYIEAMIAIASYRESLPFYCTLEHSGKEELMLRNGYHPLLKAPVANSVETERPILITGSNASGKSTFLKMTALNALFAQTVNTVCAGSIRMPFYRIYSSMMLTDSLETNESYYMVEIRSIKRIMDAAEGEPRALCFVDEVLRGTNTVERIAASSQILKSLAEQHVMAFAATHDIELTDMLANHFDNYHFEEEIVDGSIHFSYKLLDGKAHTRNAIRLLSIMGYDESVIESAEQTAEHFMEEGTWPVLQK